MAKSRKKANTPQAKRFGVIVKAANVVCHRDTNSVNAYKKCMSSAMKAKLPTGGKKKNPLLKCKGTYSSGPNKGKVKPGYRRGAAGRCPVKKKK